LEINRPNEFYQILTETLNSITPVVFHGWHEVRYSNKQEVWNGKDWGSHPALLKDSEYKAQGELRAIWEPRIKQPIVPVNVCNYRLGQLCSAVSLDKRKNSLLPGKKRTA
jgi:hypothetical protein